MRNAADLDHKGWGLHNSRPGVMELPVLSHQQSSVNQEETALVTSELKTVKTIAIHLRLIHTNQEGIKSFQFKTDIIADINKRLARLDLSQQAALSLARPKECSLIKRKKVDQRLPKVLP